MIFISKDENGIPAWKKVLDGSKTVTRRVKPLIVGTEFAIQPGRGVKAVCRAVVISCIPHDEWSAYEIRPFEGTKYLEKAMLFEAKEEGFETVKGWVDWYPEHGIDISKTYRIGFKKV